MRTIAERHHEVIALTLFTADEMLDYIDDVAGLEGYIEEEQGILIVYFEDDSYLLVTEFKDEHGEGIRIQAKSLQGIH